METTRPPKRNIIWSGAATDPSGYGEATRGYIMALSRATELNVKLINKTFWAGDVPDLRHIWPALSKMAKNDFDRRANHISIQHLTPDQYVLSAGNCIYQIGMTTFETTSIPATWQMNMRAMDELFTFSNWAKEMFENAGIRRPITVIPHGVDVVRFNPGVEPLDELKPDPDGAVKPDDFVFGSNFDWTERKNPFALLRAYFSAFKAEDPVVLVIKSYYQFPLEASRQYITDYIAHTKRGMGLTKTPRILLITDMLDQDALPRFYASLNGYVLPSRGEGWSLTHSEAMATGLPTIALKWGGQTEFMNESNSYLCSKFDMETITADVAMHQPHYVGHQWASVNVEELASKMREIYDHREAAAAIGVKARETMVENFTWVKAANLLRARLSQIYDG